MSERDEYYQTTIQLDATLDYEGRLPVLLKVHQSTERYYSGHREIVPVPKPRGSGHLRARPYGERTYFHGKPFTLQPDAYLDVALTLDPAHQDLVGTVLAHQHRDFRHQELGTCQGWYYPGGPLILWEVLVHSRARRGPPYENDELLNAVWSAWEQTLITRCPDATAIYTPWADPAYEPIDEYQRFLRVHGYEQSEHPGAFIKNLREAATI
ncbi:MAG: hypothetical protein HY329_12710 [Chloroflexi bacterium]|nr:hypothetical protein [Chloroflexota bacterium]